MPSQSVEESAGGGVPQLDMVVEGGGGDESTGGGEGDVVDLFLVAEEAGEGFDGRVAGVRGGRRPQVDCAIVRGGDEAFDEGVVDCCGGFEPLFCFCRFLGVGCGDAAGVVVVGGSEDEVSGEGEMVYPVCVGGQSAD